MYFHVATYEMEEIPMKTLNVVVKVLAALAAVAGGAAPDAPGVSSIYLSPKSPIVITLAVESFCR